MSRSVVLPGIVLGLAPALWGCGESGSFVPPPPPELNAPSFSATESARVVELILVSEDTPDRRTWSQVVRMEAGVARASFRSAAVPTNAPPRQQADLIRSAAARGASVLIVEPAESPEIAEALDQVRAQGVPVVLLDRALDSPSGKPFPAVVPAPCEDTVRAIVEAAVADAKTAKLPADGSALIVAPKPPDIHSDEMRDAFQQALKKAGVSRVETVDYKGTIDDAQTNVSARIKADPKLTLVLAVTGEGLSGAVNAREKFQDEHLVITAGFTESSVFSNEIAFHSCAAVADRNLMKAAREAFRLAMRLADGESVPDRNEIAPTFRRFHSNVPEPVPMVPNPNPMPAPASKSKTP